MPDEWLESLNPQQSAAVRHGDGPLLIIAGAGTGKTKTLASRVAYLINHGVASERICLLTFTRRAAAEMVNRARALITDGTPVQIWGGTFHAIAHRLLRVYAAAVGLHDGFSVMDEADASELMSLIRSTLDLKTRERRFPRPQTLVGIYSRVVSTQRKLKVVLDQYFPWCADELDDIRLIFETYATRKRTAQLLDFDDLLLYWRALCHSSARHSITQKFDYILVDEYQDTNPLQADILRAMCDERRNLTVVGDDAQSIYSFRAATVENMLDFPEQYTGTTRVTLETNYRSTQPILDVANEVIAPAARQHAKTLRAVRPGGHKPTLIQCIDEAEQCRIVCENILDHLEDGIPLNRQAVLMRAGHHSDQLEVELSRRNIPFHKFGGLKFIEAAHVKDLLSFLRILENPHDELSWYRILQLMDGIGPRIANRVMTELGVGQHDSKTPIARLLDAPPEVPPPAREHFEQFRHIIRDCQQTAARETLAVQVERIRALYDGLLQQKYVNWNARQRDCEQLSGLAARYTSRSTFIADLSLDPPNATSDFAQAPHLDEDYLTLSTIHSAKGCEWDVIHVLHVADGMIPSDMALGEDDGLDEERRLLYVALTRARDHLYLYFPLRYYHRNKGLSDAHSHALVSRFITQEVKALLEEKAASRDTLGGGPDMGHPDDWLKQLWN